MSHYITEKEWRELLDRIRNVEVALANPNFQAEKKESAVTAGQVMQTLKNLWDNSSNFDVMSDVGIGDHGNAGAEFNWRSHRYVISVERF